MHASIVAADSGRVSRCSKQQVIVTVTVVSPTLVKKNRFAFALLGLTVLFPLESESILLLALLGKLDDDDEDAVQSGVTWWTAIAAAAEVLLRILLLLLTPLPLTSSSSSSTFS